MTNRHELDQATAYQIRLKGVLDSSWSDWFGGFSLTVQGDETVLAGSVPDQAALHGILAKINDLGLAIISVNKLPQGDVYSDEAPQAGVCQTNHSSNSGKLCASG